MRERLVVEEEYRRLAQDLQDLAIEVLDEIDDQIGRFARHEGSLYGKLIVAELTEAAATIRDELSRRPPLTGNASAS